MTASDVHARIEEAFGVWGRWVSRHPLPATLLSLALMLALASGIPRIHADFSEDSFLLAGDETLAAFDAFRDRYGHDDRIFVAVEGQRVFDLEFLSRLRALHRDIEANVPYVYESLSLVNARSTRGVGDELVVDELGERWPEDAAELALWRERVMSNPLYVDAFISRDARSAAVLIEPNTYSDLGPDSGAPPSELLDFDDAPRTAALEPPPYLTSQEYRALVDALAAVVERHDTQGFRVAAVGGEILGARLEKLSYRDTQRFMSLCIVLIGAFLFALFRRVTAALLPIGVVIASVVSAFGVMGYLDLPFTTVTQILPAFLIAVGICDSVHVLSYVYRGLAEGKSRQEAVAHAVAGTGVAITLTSLTTAGGLASFTAAAIRPVVHLGILSPIGVVLALIFSLTLLPALLSLIPLKPPKRERDRGVASFVGNALTRLADFSTAHPGRILAATAVLVLALLPAVANVRFSNDLLGFFWPDDPVRRDLERIDETYRGISAVEVVVDTGRENGLYEPGTLRRIERVARYLEQLRVGRVETGPSVSLVDIVHEIHAALNGGDPSQRVIPDDRNLVAQELLLFENSGSDDLLDVTDASFREARLTLRVRWEDGMHYVTLLEELERGVAEILGPELPFTVTGGVAISSRGFAVLLGSLVRSYALALAVITPLMMLLLASFGRGLLAMIPNVFPVYATLALMGAAGIPMNLSTVLMGSVVIGLAVDDTIHFVHHFDRARARGMDPRKAVHQTFASVGPALFVTSLVLAGSFSTFLLAEFVGVFHFGLLTTFAVVVAFLADVVLAPALLVKAADFSAGREARSRTAEPVS